MHSSATDGSHPTRVLVVDADRRVRASLERLISVSDGFVCVRCVDNTTDALGVLESQPVEAMLIDPRLPDIEIGMAFLQQVHVRWPELKLVAMSGSLDLAPASLRDGIRFVSKTGQPEELLAELTQERAAAIATDAPVARTATPEGGAVADCAGIV